MPDYLPDKTCRVLVQLSRSTDGENVNSYGFIKQAEIRFIRGWIDTSGKENIRIESNFGHIITFLPEGAYTVEATLPDEEPKYYHIIVSDNLNFINFSFEI